jgi:hypothetical protein
MVSGAGARRRGAWFSVHLRRLSIPLFQFTFTMRLTHRTNHCRRRGDESLISFFRVLWTLIRDSSPRLLQWLVSFRG